MKFVSRERLFALTGFILLPVELVVLDVGVLPLLVFLKTAVAAVGIEARAKGLAYQQPKHERPAFFKHNISSKNTTNYTL